jgi:diguanylate cyclase (GGDEF)-like protein
VLGDERGQAATLSDPLAALPDAVCHLDRDWRFTYLNATVAALARSEAADLLGRPLLDCFPAVRGTALEEGIRSVLSDGLPRTFDFHDATRNRWYEARAFPDDTGTAVVLRPREELSGAGPADLAWQLRHDDLTGLPNRAEMLELIEQALQEAPAGGPGTAVLYLDLDGFKTVNDSLGHEVGDGLLGEVARRLAEHVRPGDAVGRLGGDQFLVLARGCDSAEAAALAFRLQTTFTLPFSAEGLSVPLTASIGVAVGTAGERDAHGLLTDADAAMYAAKASGRERVHLFSPSLREAARWRLEVASRLRHGAVDQLVVHYQPVVRLDTGAVEGVEALIRWQHPERGLLMPDAFLAVAEETGQLIPITRWLLR